MRPRCEFLLFIGLLGGIAQCQQTLPVATSTVGFSSHSPVVLYHLIRGTAALDRQAAELDKQDGSGKYLRAAFSDTVGFADSDAQAFLAFVRASDQRFDLLDQQATQIIEKARAQRTSEGVIPPPPLELTVLQKQKAELMRQLPSALDQAQLSEAGRETLHGYLVRAAAKTRVIDPSAQ